MSPTIPPGLRVELLSAPVRPGMSEQADRWMRMLEDRAEECVATLDRERMAVEVVFRLRERDTDTLYWVCIRGPEGADLDEALPIDRDHARMSREVTVPGWTRAEPQVLLLPEPVRRAVLEWAFATED